MMVGLGQLVLKVTRVQQVRQVQLVLQVYWFRWSDTEFEDKVTVEEVQVDDHSDINALRFGKIIIDKHNTSW